MTFPHDTTPPFTARTGALAAEVVQRRGLNREQAAAYVGVGTTKFDEMMRDGRMPKPKKIDGRRVWDRYALDRAFEELPDIEDSNPWDD